MVVRYWFNAKPVKAFIDRLVTLFTQVSPISLKTGIHGGPAN